VRVWAYPSIKSNKYKDKDKNFVKLYYIKSNILWNYNKESQLPNDIVHFSSLFHSLSRYVTTQTRTR